MSLIILLLIAHSALSENPIEVTDGQDVTLPCKFEHYDPGSVVAWEKYTPGQGQDDWTALFFDHTRNSEANDRMDLPENQPFGYFDLHIRQVQSAVDTGRYRCSHNEGAENFVHTFTLRVKTPPVVTIIPERSPYTVELDKPISLECKAVGEPMPTVTWRRQGQTLPDGRQEAATHYLRYDHATPDHEGVYVCTASNGIGAPVQANATVEIRRKPSVLLKVDPANVAISGHFGILCEHGDLEAGNAVEWFFNGRPIQASSTQPLNFQRDASKSGITVSNVSIENLGNYTCRVQGTQGIQEASIVVSAPPSKPLISSDFAESAFVVHWTTQSLTPILEHQFKYRLTKDQVFSQAAVTVTPGHEGQYKAQHSIENWKPDSLYEVEISSKNERGWSDVARQSISTVKHPAFEQQTNGIELDASRSDSGTGSGNGAPKISSELSVSLQRIFLTLLTSFVFSSLLAL